MSHGDLKFEKSLREAAGALVLPRLLSVPERSQRLLRLCVFVTRKIPHPRHQITERNICDLRECQVESGPIESVDTIIPSSKKARLGIAQKDLLYQRSISIASKRSERDILSCPCVCLIRNDYQEDISPILE